MGCPSFSRAEVLELEPASRVPGRGCSNTQVGMACPTPESLTQEGRGLGLRICLSKEFPSDVAGLGNPALGTAAPVNLPTLGAQDWAGTVCVLPGHVEGVLPTRTFPTSGLVTMSIWVRLKIKNPHLFETHSGPFIGDM